jgi:hypothetical protein
MNKVQQTGTVMSTVPGDRSDLTIQDLDGLVAVSCQPRFFEPSI